MINSKLYNKSIIDSLTSIVNKEKLFNKSFLVTGASGLIGKALIKSLSALNSIENANIKIIACGRNVDKLKDIFSACNDKNISYQEYDANKEVTCKEKVDFVVHLAAITSSKQFAENPNSVLFESINSIKNILDFAVGKNVERLLYLSSQEVYGEPYDFQNELKETDLGFIDLTSIRSIYPETKRLGELMCSTYFKLKNLNTVVVRLAKVFGPDVEDNDVRIGADFLRKAANGEDIVLNTKGVSKTSFSYIIDATTSILSILTSGASGECYNACPCGDAITPFDFASTCAKEGNVKVVVKEATSDMGYSKVSHMKQNFDKLSTLGYKSKYTIESAVKESIRVLKGE